MINCQAYAQHIIHFERLSWRRRLRTAIGRTLMENCRSRQGNQIEDIIQASSSDETVIVRNSYIYEYISKIKNKNLSLISIFYSLR